ncbi:DUF1534 domain-containing protein [Pseudomonas syringae pv. actinidiae]|nr:DUF1534 domain-containing protein [Pseudomonas syringae pv. actinidiae]
MRLSFPTLCVGNAVRDALRRKNEERRASGTACERRASHDSHFQGPCSSFCVLFKSNDK